MSLCVSLYDVLFWDFFFFFFLPKIIILPDEPSEDAHGVSVFILEKLAPIPFSHIYT